MKLLIASDHRGFDLKSFLINELRGIKLEVSDFGTDCGSVSVDYPDFAIKLCSNLGKSDFGILICGSGIGMSIQANRYFNIRAALVYTEECAKLAREHNDANVLVLGSDFISNQLALSIVNIFLESKFLGGRHEARVEKLKIF